jgi:hypothetical protein
MHILKVAECRPVSEVAALEKVTKMDDGPVREEQTFVGASAAQKFFFETNGYLVLPGALDQNELAVLRAAADAAEAK